ncbi:MAG: MBL fold metallo-hydrolase [Tissierellia bacterium]|nr:MBL fold metallo-hydrolase [Tissierellia bacterium]
MKFCALASGSSGNCQYIETDEARILVDAGLSGRAIERNLRQIQVEPSTLDAIFVTHEHTDHVQGVGVLARRYGLEVFAGAKTWMGMEAKVQPIDGAKRNVFVNYQPFRYRDLNVLPITTFHDCQEGSGFVFESRGKKLSVLTDTGWVNGQMLQAMENSQLYYLESNHDLEMLKNGPYPRHLKERILSTRGHLSNVNAAEVLAQLLKKKQERVILAHLSGENNLPLLAARTIREHLNSERIIDGVDFIMDVAKPKLPSKTIAL